MKRHHMILAASATMFLSAAAASADCREELAQLSGGISKDGSLAPLQDSPDDATPQTGGGDAAAAPAEGEGLAKDGSNAPMGADPAIATSAQDAQAQQQGGDTAAEQAAGAAGAGGSSDREEALTRAQAALDAGDEAGCMAAVQEAKG